MSALTRPTSQSRAARMKFLNPPLSLRSSSTTVHSSWCVLSSPSHRRRSRCFSLQSRAAAVNELRGESPADCETAYESALWLLYALLDDTLSPTSSSSAPDPVAEEDRTTVNRFVKSISARLEALRKKIAPVVPPASSAAGTTVVSGSSTPMSAGTAVATSSPPS
jgi:hypothetical protein